MHTYCLLYIKWWTETGSSGIGIGSCIIIMLYNYYTVLYRRIKDFMRDDKAMKAI